MQGAITYRIPSKRLTWSLIFKHIEANKERLGIIDYSVTQTTLEQVSRTEFFLCVYECVCERKDSERERDRQRERERERERVMEFIVPYIIFLPRCLSILLKIKRDLRPEVTM